MRLSALNGQAACSPLARRVSGEQDYLTTRHPVDFLARLHNKPTENASIHSRGQRFLAYRLILRKSTLETFRYSVTPITGVSERRLRIWCRQERSRAMAIAVT